MDRRIATENYGLARKPASFGLSAFIFVDSPTCPDHDSELALTSLGDVFTAGLRNGETSSPNLKEEAGDDHDEEEDAEVSVEEKAAYWKKQQQLLLAALRRNSFFEENVRGGIERALCSAPSSSLCSCKKKSATVGGSCRICLQHHVVSRLREVGHHATICRSKWKSSPDMPAGEHSYIDVVSAGGDITSTTKRVVVELDLRAEFEMVRGSSDYNQLVAQLPELFIGKPSRLKEVVKVVCSAAKRCMKEKKMHLGPWRRHKYMHAKWFGMYERIESPPLLPAYMHVSEKQHKKEFDMSKRISNFAVVRVMI